MFDFIEYKKRFLEATKDWNNEKWNNFDDNPFLLSAQCFKMVTLRIVALLKVD